MPGRRKKPKLSSPQRALLRKSSAEAVQKKMKRVASYLQEAYWLPSSNSYRLKPLEKVRLQAKANPPKLRKGPLTEYIAASCALHCIDGWSFLARAFCALVQGDPDAVRHFGYYAELRGAMALLAGQGTGVFNQSHVIVDKTGACEPLKGFGTHEAVWMFLEYWGERKGADSLLKSIIRPGNRALDDWVSAFGAGGVTSKLIAKQWCKLWGLDLQRLSRDRDSRNQSSYEPTQLAEATQVSAQIVAGFISDFWQTFQPWPPNFGVIDAFLLRKLLQDIFVSTQGPPIDNPSFKTLVDKAIETVQPSGMSAGDWSTFLCAPAEPPVLAFASLKDEPSAATHHIQVLCRAALLLRLAAGSSEGLFQSASVDRMTVGFWCSQFGMTRGIWQVGQQPEDMLDLWKDIQDALEKLDEWRATNSPTVSQANFRREQVVPLQVLCECERIALWSVTP